MTTIDNLLLKIVNCTEPTIEEMIPQRDSKVLRSLSTAVSGPLFITENQSRLLLKILKDQAKKMKNFEAEINELLALPTWSRQFRKIDQVRKMYIGTINDSDPMITIEFTFSAQIRKILTNLARKTDNLLQSSSGKVYHADLTEHNVVTLVEALLPHNFEIEETLKNHYETIKSWSENEVRNQFLLTNISHTNFQKSIAADLGMETPIDENIINDRSVRYQYFTENVKKTGENLTEIIATRQKTKIWIDSTKYSLSEIIKSLVELKRLPAMFVFDGFNVASQDNDLKKLAFALDANGIYDKVGVYFRLPNNPIGKEFNELIAQRQYNYKLDADTNIVGVQSGKIPKFFLKTDWKPMSVISIGNTLRHSKTAVYANCCDLIISYTDKQPLMEHGV